MASVLLSQFDAAKRPQFVHSSSRQPSGWAKPDTGWRKLNTDASINKDGRTGLGAVIRDENGKVMASRIELREGSMEVATAEALSCFEGVKLAMSIGIGNLVIETDNTTLFRLLSGTQADSTYCGAIASNISRLIRTSISCRFSLIRRTGNCLAHHLSRFAFSFESPGVFSGAVPASLEQFVLGDV